MSKSILPYPSLQFFPKLMRDSADDGTRALAAKLDALLLRWEALGIGIEALHRPEECPGQFLEELGYIVNAGIRPLDSEQTRRKKILYAVQAHKRRGSWRRDAKIKIDAITGLSPGARLVDYGELGTDEWILCSDDAFPGAYYWATMGYDGIDLELGIGLCGGYDDYELAGNVFIDCHEGVSTPVLSAATIEQIVGELEFDIAPAYFRIFLGYIDGTGAFQHYPGGSII
jgi:hypothetical protein